MLQQSPTLPLSGILPSPFAEFSAPTSGLAEGSTHPSCSHSFGALAESSVNFGLYESVRLNYKKIRCKHTDLFANSVI